MSLGEVDTLNLLSEKLENLFNESQGYYESFLDANNLYKNGKLSDKEFFAKLGDYTVAYSALEFLAIKVILEMKKSLDKMAGGQAPGGTQFPSGAQRRSTRLSGRRRPWYLAGDDPAVRRTGCRVRARGHGMPVSWVAGRGDRATSKLLLLPVAPIGTSAEYHG